MIKAIYEYRNCTKYENTKAVQKVSGHMPFSLYENDSDDFGERIF